MQSKNSTFLFKFELIIIHHIQWLCMYPKLLSVIHVPWNKKCYFVYFRRSSYDQNLLTFWVSWILKLLLWGIVFTYLERCGCDLKCVIFIHVSLIAIWAFSVDATKWVPRVTNRKINIDSDKSLLSSSTNIVMFYLTWCHWARSR